MISKCCFVIYSILKMCILLFEISIIYLQKSMTLDSNLHFYSLVCNLKCIENFNYPCLKWFYLLDSRTKMIIKWTLMFKECLLILLTWEIKLKLSFFILYCKKSDKGMWYNLLKKLELNITPSSRKIGMIERKEKNK